MKTPTAWSANPASETNEYPYNSAVFAYNSSTQNYDGVVDSDQKDRDIEPTNWNRVDKTPSGWSNANTKVPATWGDA